MQSEGLVIDTIVCLTLTKWETVSGQFGGYLSTSHFIFMFYSACLGKSAKSVQLATSWPGNIIMMLAVTVTNPKKKHT